MRRSLFAGCVAVLGLCLALAPVRAQTKHSKKTPKEVPFSEAEMRHAPGDTVAVVDGVVITFQDFNSIMAGYLKTFVARTNNNLVTDSLYTVIVDSAWDRAVSDIVIEQAIAKQRVEMNDREVKDSLVHNPPDFLRSQFSDSLGHFRPEIMRQAMDDPRNDSIVRVIVEGERERLETERLAERVAPKARTPAERERMFDAWLRHAKLTAHIDDRRTRFGFY